jgi:gluconokinase
MSYYLGIDIGTTSTKAVAFSDTGAVLASKSIGYGMQHPQPDRSEQNPGEIVQAVISSLNEVVERLTPDVPAFVSFSAAMHSLLAVDESGNPLTSCIIWADNRAESIAENLRGSEQGAGFYYSTGVPVHCMSPLLKLLWLKENDPVVFQTAHKFIGIKEYLFFKLFGAFIVDTSIASATGLLNIKSLEWDENILNFLGITSSRLSQVVSTRHVLYYQHIHPQLYLPLHTPVVIGASDGALANLGTGATGNHAMACTVGTSGAVRMIVKEARTDRFMRTFCYHVRDDEYITGGATNNGAVVMQWLRETLLQTSESYEQLFDEAQTVAPGSGGLLFLPYILGERAPMWQSCAKGVYFGLSIQHSKAHLIRASMEGVVYALYSIGNALAEGKEVTELHASGGFARSALWLQMLADVFNIKVLVTDTVESAALGAVMLGAASLGLEQHFAKNVVAVYQPDASHHEVYQKCFEKFMRIYQALKEEMR